ncbi:MAG: DUF479 domain-containing protein [Gammaproteobacteria bacterium]|nr:DUF479 domain-containing protein [Gammaproteobacteria bacterium]
MNFLAHCLLGHPHEALMAGGFIGDFIKGPVPDTLPPELQAGVRLHRRVDAVSNRLPGIRTSVRRLDPELRRVAPVLLDILADHCLATRWDRHGHGDLAAFSASAYDAIHAYASHLPANGQRFFRRMREVDLFVRYLEPETPLRAMEYVLERLRHEHLAPKLDHLVSAGLPSLMNDFDGYFPELRSAVVDWKEEAGYA